MTNARDLMVKILITALAELLWRCKKCDVDNSDLADGVYVALLGIMDKRQAAQERFAGVQGGEGQ